MMHVYVHAMWFTCACHVARMHVCMPCGAYVYVYVHALWFVCICACHVCICRGPMEILLSSTDGTAHPSSLTHPDPQEALLSIKLHPCPGLPRGCSRAVLLSHTHPATVPSSKWPMSID